MEECNTVNDLRCNQVKEEDTRTWRRRIVTTRGPVCDTIETEQYTKYEEEC